MHHGATPEVATPAADLRHIFPGLLIFRFVRSDLPAPPVRAAVALGSFGQICLSPTSEPRSRWVRSVAFHLEVLASSRGRSWQDHIQGCTGPPSAREISVVIMGHHVDRGHSPRGDSDRLVVLAVGARSPGRSSEQPVHLGDHLVLHPFLSARQQRFDQRGEVENEGRGARGEGRGKA